MQEVETVGARCSKRVQMGMSLPPLLRSFVLAKVSLEGGKVQVLWLSRWKEQGREGLQRVSLSESWIR